MLMFYDIVLSWTRQWKAFKIVKILSKGTRLWIWIEGHYMCEERGDTIRAMGDENELSDCCKGAMLETKKLQWIRF